MSTLPPRIQSLVGLRPGDQRIHIVATRETRTRVIVVDPKRDKFKRLPKRYFELLRQLKECWDADKLNKRSFEGFRTEEALSDLLDFEDPDTVPKYFGDIRRMLKEIGIDVEVEIYEKDDFCGYRIRDGLVVIKRRPRRHANVRHRGQSFGS